MPILSIGVNSAFLQEELNWLIKLIDARIAYMGAKHGPAPELDDFPPPKLPDTEAPYPSFIEEHNLSSIERVILILATANRVSPEVLDVLDQKNERTGRRFSPFGALLDSQNNILTPTVLTAKFIVGGDLLSAELDVSFTLEEHHIFRKENILAISWPPEGIPYHTMPIALTHDGFELLCRGIKRKPRYSDNFPAKLITTKLNWDDLVLHGLTVQELAHLRQYAKFEKICQEDAVLSKYVKKGFRALFHGPPGTGKTLTATLLGKWLERDVYRIDLSQMVSKYIGETEKNLSRLFERARNKDWILFFDEADALFGKRTQVSDAHDRHANQETSYLLQEIEDYNGMVILASNFKDNLDSAFIRRFQSLIHFPMPGPKERAQIWANTLPESFLIDPNINIDDISHKYTFDGASIVSIVQFCTLSAIGETGRKISKQNLMAGIRRELAKNGRTR